MWIFCCGMMRSGSTLQFQITARLVEQTCRGKRMEWVKPENFAGLRLKYADYPGWKVFKSHICTDAMMEEFTQGTARGIYVYRDLRDVIVSILRKRRMPFDREFVENYLRTCMHQYERWTCLPGVLVSRYEDMISDLPREVRRIAGHLNIPISDTDSEAISSDYGMERQRQRIERLKQSASYFEHAGTDAVFHPYSLLHIDHIHSGKAGGWKEMLSSDQIALIENRAAQWLMSHRYTLTHETAGSAAGA